MDIMKGLSGFMTPRQALEVLKMEMANLEREVERFERRSEQRG